MTGFRLERKRKEGTFLESVKHALEDLRRDIAVIKSEITHMNAAQSQSRWWEQEMGLHSGVFDSSWEIWGDLGFENNSKELLQSSLRADAPFFSPNVDPLLAQPPVIRTDLYDAQPTQMDRETLLSFRFTEHGDQDKIVLDAPQRITTLSLHPIRTDDITKDLPGDFRSLPTATWEAIHSPFKARFAKRHHNVEHACHASEPTKEKLLEFSAHDMHKFIDVTVDTLRESPQWTHIPASTLADLITDLKAEYRDSHERSYSKAEAIELMAVTGRRCGEALQMDRVSVLNCTSPSVEQRIGVTGLDGGQSVQPAPGDFAMLQGLSDTNLNGEKGFILELVSSGRFRLQLGHRSLNRVVAVRPENLVVVEVAANIAAVRKLRDNGCSVSSLIAQGYSIAAIQLDDSNAQCSGCCRPRYMCSCTYGYTSPPTK